MTVTRTDSAALPLAAQGLADEIADRLAVPPAVGGGLPDWWPQSLAHGGAGIALLHIERAAIGRAEWSRARAWLQFATSRALSVGPNAALYHGAPAIEFVVRAAAPYIPGVAARSLPALEIATDEVVHRRLADARRRLRGGGHPPLAEFDCIRGLSGLGALLLRRADPSASPLGDLLVHLVALTEPILDGGDLLPGWWTDLAPNSKPSSADFAGGHSNSGMAHGIAGVLSMLALALRRGTTVDGHAEAIERILAWLDWWRQRGGTGPWWPYWITREELRRGRAGGGPRRLSWCYGALGLARAQQLAALALNDPVRRKMAEGAAVAALSDPVQLGRIEDASLCHGYAGLIHIAALLAADSPTPCTLTDLIPGLFDSLAKTLARSESTDPGWLEGRAGIALALHAMAVRPATGWDGALLIA
jgi:lantibiotic biosynthesis protein